MINKLESKLISKVDIMLKLWLYISITLMLIFGSGAVLLTILFIIYMLMQILEINQLFNYLDYETMSYLREAENLFSIWISPAYLKAKSEGSLDNQRCYCHLEGEFDCTNCETQEECNIGLLRMAINELHLCVYECDYDSESEYDSDGNELVSGKGRDCIYDYDGTDSSTYSNCSFGYTGCCKYRNLQNLCIEFNYKLSYSFITSNKNGHILKEIQIHNEDNKLIIRTRVGYDENGFELGDEERKIELKLPLSSSRDELKLPLSSSGIENVLLLDGRLLHCSEHGVECKCQINKVIDQICQNTLPSGLSECLEFKKLLELLQGAGYYVTEEGLINYIKEQIEGVPNTNYEWESALIDEAQLYEDNKWQYLEQLESKKF